MAPLFLLMFFVLSDFCVGLCVIKKTQFANVWRDSCKNAAPLDIRAFLKIFEAHILEAWFNEDIVRE